MHLLTKGDESVYVKAGFISASDFFLHQLSHVTAQVRCTSRWPDTPHTRLAKVYISKTLICMRIRDWQAWTGKLGLAGFDWQAWTGRLKTGDL